MTPSPAPPPFVPGMPLTGKAVLRWRQRPMDTLAQYLPLFLMALLAIGTWWLVKLTPVPEPEKAAALPVHEPDYAMSNFNVQRFTTAGILVARVQGDALRHYPDTSAIEVDAIRFMAIAPDGRTTNAVATRALANDRLTEVQLLGHAQVVRAGNPGEPAIEFRGEALKASQQTQTIESVLPLTLRQGATEIRADAMTFNNQTGVAQMKGKISASLPPHAVREPTR